MAASRRNILVMLGLASAASAAVASDDIVADREEAGPYRLARFVDRERAAKALELLAGEIRAGGVNVAQFDIATKIGADDWLRQELTIGVEIKHEA